MDKLKKKLRDAEEKASDAYLELKKEHDAKRSDLYSEARERIDATLDAEYRERLIALNQARYAAEQAMLEWTEANAVAKAPYPVGTKLIGWEKTHSHGYGPNTNPLEPKYAGILEVVTRTAEHPAQMTYSKASVGSYIVRLCLKNGAVGKAYKELGSCRDNIKWLPVGEKPKD